MADQTDWQAFGEWLYRRRMKLGLTQREAAKRAGISRVYWSRMESRRKVKRPRKGKVKRLREGTVKRIALAVNGRVARALALLSFPEEVVHKARLAGASEADRLETAENAFRAVLLSEKDYPEVAFDLMQIYRTYHRERLAAEFARAPVLYDYEPVVERVVALPPYRQWRLARKIILHLWETGQLFHLPEIPEHKEENREQSRVLKIAAMSIKELRIEAKLREEADRRKQTNATRKG